MAELTMEDARKGLAAGVAKAEEIGSPSSIAIVDSGRNLVAFIRMDEALLASIEISQAKAYTARSLNMRTGDLMDLVKPGGPLYGMETSHRQALVVFGGGEPIRRGGEVVGGVGVAGGTVPQDEEIAAAVATAIGS